MGRKPRTFPAARADCRRWRASSGRTTAPPARPPPLSAARRPFLAFSLSRFLALLVNAGAAAAASPAAAPAMDVEDDEDDEAVVALQAGRRVSKKEVTLSVVPAQPPCCCFLSHQDTELTRISVLARSLAGSDARACASERALGGPVRILLRCTTSPSQLREPSSLLSRGACAA